MARGMRPGFPGAEHTASSTSSRAVAVNCMSAGTYTAPGDASSNTLERPPIRLEATAPDSDVGGPCQYDDADLAVDFTAARNLPRGKAIDPKPHMLPARAFAA